MTIATDPTSFQLSCQLQSAQDLLDLAAQCEKALKAATDPVKNSAQLLFQLPTYSEQKTSLQNSNHFFARGFLQFLLSAKERTQHMWGKYQQSQNLQCLDILEHLHTKTQINTELFPHYQRRLFSQTEQFMTFEHCLPKDKLYTGFVNQKPTTCHIESYAYYELTVFDNHMKCSEPLWSLLLELHSSQTYPQHMLGLIVRPHTQSEVREAYAISTRLQTLGQQALELLR